MNRLPAFGLNRKSALGISPADRLRYDGLDPSVGNISTYLQISDYPTDHAAVQNQICSEFSNTAVAARVLDAAAGNRLKGCLRQLGRRHIEIVQRNGGIPFDAVVFCGKLVAFSL